MTPTRVPSGLYAITDSQLIQADHLIESVTRAIEGGAVMVQYRDKHHSANLRRCAAGELSDLCHHHNIPLIINDDIELAHTVGADGVHLGQQDAAPGQARDRLGDHAIIGVSCYDRVEHARRAQAAGASYVAFGRFFPSATKPDAIQARLSLLADARRELELPIAAIGGITPGNGAGLVTAGADLLAVIHGLFGQSDIRATAQRYAVLFDNTSGS